MKILYITYCWYDDPWLPYLMAKQGHKVDLLVLNTKERVPTRPTNDNLRIFLGKSCITFISDDIHNNLAHYDMIINISTYPQCIELTNHFFAISAIKPVVYGSRSSVFTDLENDRENFKSLCKNLTVPTPSYVVLSDLDLVKDQYSQYVSILKPNKVKHDYYYRWSALDLSSYKTKDSVAKALEVFKKSHEYMNFDKLSYILESKIDGYEIAVGSYFNGTNFTGPILYMYEHKKVCAGNVGPNIEEPGVYITTEEPYCSSILLKHFSKFEQYLKDRNYVGHFNVNFIVNDKDVYAIEPDCRYPFPASCAFFSDMLDQGIDLAEFHYNLAMGRDIYSGDWTPAKHMIGAMLFTLGFPDCTSFRNVIKGLPVEFEDNNKVFPLEMDYTDTGYVVSDDIFSGHLLQIASSGSTLEEARSNYLNQMQSIGYPFKIYRTDIGQDLMSASKGE